MELTADLVRPDALEPGDLIEDYGPYEDNYEPFALNSPRSFASRTRNGVFGDARQASKEIGAEISDVVVKRVSEFVAAFADREPHVS
jgi:creatinine amidohydrolase